ncbi:MAG: DUF6311 domain-containing protein [Myxococcaceae bacterium]|nr:DUF6311 domain-containing protein [Myxococcaceae bacterium]
MSDSSTWQRWAPRVEVGLLVACGMAWAASRTGWQILDVRQTSWLNNGDWQAYQQGFLMYVRGPWTLQLGAIPGLLYPDGMSVFYTTSGFWPCLAGKLLALVLPGEFQLYGCWIFTCYVAQALAARFLLAEAGVTGLARVGGAVLALVDPVVMARNGHLVLMFQAVLVVQLGLAIRAVRRPEDAERTARLSLLVPLFAVGLEAYLPAQVIPLCVATLLITHLRGGRPWVRLARDLAVLVAGLVAMLWLVGAIPAGEVERNAEGFGQFSSDLLALVNSQNLSRWLPSLPASPRQGEGYAYLGVGVLALVPVAVVAFVREAKKHGAFLKGLAPVLVVTVLLAGYAWSSHVTVLGREVLNLEWLFAPFSVLTSTFRACGRFIWALHYVVSFGVIVLVARLLQRRAVVALVAFVVAAVAQGGELISDRTVYVRPAEPPVDAGWIELGKTYRHVALVPLQLQWICGYDIEAVWQLTRAAALSGMTINSGHVGRVPKRAREACGQPFEGPMDAKTVYVVSPPNVGDPGLRGAQCRSIGRYALCLPPH